MKYTLVRIIGTGGWGEVWEAVNEANSETVAIKILRPAGSHSRPGRKARERFKREAQVMCRLQSPWLCHAYTCCEEEDSPYMAFVMEYINGCNLSEYVRKNGVPTSEEIKKWLYQLLSALDEIHNRGIVHRDIKPSNIMLQPSGDVKLFDFGICKDLTVDFDNTHVAVYSTYYASPEQKIGDPNASLDGMTDFYALGKTIWFLATGKTPPPTAMTPQHIDQVNDEELRRAISAMTCENPDERREATNKYISSVAGLIPDELPTMADTEDNYDAKADTAVDEVDNPSETPTMVDEGVTSSDPSVKPTGFRKIKKWSILLLSILSIGLGVYFLTRAFNGSVGKQSQTDTAMNSVEEQSDTVNNKQDNTAPEEAKPVKTNNDVDKADKVKEQDVASDKKDRTDKKTTDRADAQQSVNNQGGTASDGNAAGAGSDTPGASKPVISKKEYNAQLDEKLKVVEANPTREGLREIEQFVRTNLITEYNSNRIENLRKRVK